jgi:hypothetical protein
MSVVMVRQQVKDGSVEEAEAAVRDLFATLDRVRPQGVRYAWTRVVDSSTFVILLELAEGIEDPRPAIPEYLRFLEQLPGWVDGPPVIEHLDVVGSHNLFGTQREESAVRQGGRSGQGHGQIECVQSEGSRRGSLCDWCE